MRSRLQGDLVEDVYFNLGNAYFREGRFDDAIGAYREVLLLDPDDLDAKVNLGAGPAGPGKQKLPRNARRDEGQQVPESGLGGEETKPARPRSAGGNGKVRGGRRSEDEAEQRLDDALGDAGEGYLLKKRWRSSRRSKTSRVNGTPGIDIIGVDDY